MKRFIFSILIILCMVTPSFSAVTEGGNVIKMTADEDATTGSWKITAIVWTSVNGTSISGTQGFQLTDTAGEIIAESQASTIKDEFVLTMGSPITVSGLKAEVLDGGVIFVYGSRR